MVRRGSSPAPMTVVGGSDMGPPGGYSPFHSNQPPGGPHAELCTTVGETGPDFQGTNISQPEASTPLSPYCHQ